eukprot:5369013-Pyramimonas_sp.AAC.1
MAWCTLRCHACCPSCSWSTCPACPPHIDARAPAGQVGKRCSITPQSSSCPCPAATSPCPPLPALHPAVILLFSCCPPPSIPPPPALAHPSCHPLIPSS